MFGTTTAGILVELPWDAHTSTRVAFGCSIDARWTDGETSYDGQAPHDARILHTRPRGVDRKFLPDGRHWKRIKVDADWLTALTLPVPNDGPGYEPWGPSTIESIFKATGLTTWSFSQKNLSAHSQTYIWNNRGPSAIIFTEHMLATVFADGLSRVGSFRAYDSAVSPIASWMVQNYTDILNDHVLSSISLKGDLQVLQPAFPPHKFTRLEIKEHIYGYCYNSDSISDYLAIAILLSLLIIAVSHTVWILCRRETSGCWDTVTELIALSKNSRPAPLALGNTCAGIKQLQTYGQVARIRVANDHSDGDGSGRHLELMIDKSPKKNGFHPITTTATATAMAIASGRSVDVVFGALSARPVEVDKVYGEL